LIAKHGVRNRYGSREPSELTGYAIAVEAIERGGDVKGSGAG
jgi:hypothetical protein